MASVMLTVEQITALRKIAGAQSIMIRLQGERGIQTVGKRPMQAVQSDLLQLLAAYDAVARYADQATPKCAKSA